MKKMNLILFVLSLLSLSGQFILLPQMPDTIPIHWNAAGEIDGYGSRYVSLMIAAVPLIITGLFVLIPRIDPRKQSYQKHEKAYRIFCVFVVLLFIGLVWVTNAAAMGWPVSVGRIVPIAIGLLFLVLGNYMPQIRSNYTFGIKTPWTLESPYVWKKTHAMGAFVFCIYGIVMIAAGVTGFPWMMNVSFAVILAGAAGLFVYSWLVYRKENQKNS